MNPHPASRRSWLGVLVILGLAAIYLCIAGYLVRRALPNSDEGFYAYVSQEVMRGRVPYRDFAYTQTPLLPYLQGAVMSVVGFGLREQRWINAACGLVALLLAVRLWRRHSLDWLNCTAIAVVWCLCLSLMYYTVIGKTYAWTELWLMVAATALGIRDRPWASLLLLSVAGTLAVGCRLTIAPAVMVLWLGFAVMQRGRLSWLMLFAVPLLVALVILGPFIVADPRNAFFWNIQLHLRVAIPAHRLAILWLSVTFAPVIALLGIAGAVPALRNLREPGSWLLLAGLAAWLVATAGPGVYADYAAPCFPLVLAGAGCVLAGVLQSRPRFATGLPALLAALAVGGLFLKAENYFYDGYLESIERTAAHVRAVTQPDDLILTPVPEIAVNSGRRIVPGLELGKFGLTAEMDDKMAAQRHIFTLGQLTELIDNRTAPVIVLSRHPNGNFPWSMPSLIRLSQRARREIFSPIFQGYDCTYVDDFFLVFERKGPARQVYFIDPAAL